MGASLPVLLVCTLLTLALVAAELLLGHFSHCLTLLAVTNQSVYNLLTLVFAVIAKKVTSKSNNNFYSNDTQYE